MKRNRKLGYATVAILSAVKSGSRFGLEVIESTGLTSGTVYPTLGRLTDRGFLVGQWEPETEAREGGRPPRRYYEITPEGHVALAKAAAELVSLAAAAAEPKPAGGGA